MWDISSFVNFTLLPYLRTGYLIVDIFITIIISSIVAYIMSHYENIPNLIYNPFRTKINNIDLRAEELDISGDYTIGSRSILYKSVLWKFFQTKCSCLSLTETATESYGDIGKKFYSNIRPAHGTKCILEDDIYFEMLCDEKLVTYKSSQQTKTRITLRLSSNTRSIWDLYQYINKCRDEYESFVDQTLNGTRYYLSPRYVSDLWRYDQTILTNYRTFDNLFFTEKEIVLRKLKTFLYDDELFKRTGIPRHFGVMLHGPPGTGKTSFIKALANYTNRHIVNIPLNKINTGEDLFAIFHRVEIQSKKIACGNLIYVLEDIDCLDDVVLDRNRERSSEEEIELHEKKLEKVLASKFNTGESLSSPSTKLTHTPLTLSELLNILDGIVEGEKRIVIMTTNQLAKLDPALIRPGRVDCCIEMKYATKDVITSMLNLFFPHHEEYIHKQKDSFPDEVYSAAKVTEICISVESIQEAISKICGNNQ